MPVRRSILGVGVDVIGFDEVVTLIERWRATRERRCIVVTNPHSILMCRSDHEMMAATRAGALVLADGVGTTLALRVLYRMKSVRLPGPELMLRLFDAGRATGLRHFLYGGRPDVLQALCLRLQRRFPEATMCGSFSPPFRKLSAGEDAEVVRMISNTRPDVVWVGLGAPKQEKWMAAHVGQIRAAALIGVGAAFDFHAGTVPWAPKWIRSAGLEWAYRLAHEPKRLWRRNLDSPVFLYHVLKQRLLFSVQHSSRVAWERCRRVFECLGTWGDLTPPQSETTRPALSSLLTDEQGCQRVARVLISAFACAPGMGSEPGIAWGAIQEVAREHQVWVLTALSNAEAIKAGPLNERIHFHFIGLGFAEALRNRYTYYAHYWLWQAKILLVAKRLHRRHRFDLVHHMTYGTSWVPSFLGFLGPHFLWSAGVRDKGIPFSWCVAEPRLVLYELARRLATLVFGAVSDAISGARARVTLVASEPESWPRRLNVEQFFLGGLSALELQTLADPPERRIRNRFVVLSVGRLISWKNISLGILAFERLLKYVPEAEYYIIGEGPERRRLERLAKRIRVHHRMTFLGALNRAEVFKWLRQSSVLLHPSLRESFGYAMVEAMAAGLPVVGLENAATLAIVSRDGGLFVPRHGTRAAVAKKLGESLINLAKDIKLRCNMGDAGRLRAVGTWAWPSVGARLLVLYTSILRADRREHGTRR